MTSFSSKNDNINVSKVNKNNYYMPAEWYPHTCCWMLLPYRLDNWRNSARNAQIAFINVAKAIATYEKVMLGIHPCIDRDFILSQLSNVTTNITNSTITNVNNAKNENYDHFEYSNSNSSSIKISDYDSNIELFEIEYDDCWMRDVGPTFIIPKQQQQQHDTTTKNTNDGRSNNTIATNITTTTSITSNKNNDNLVEDVSDLIAIDWIFNAWGEKYHSWEKDDEVAGHVVSYLQHHPEQYLTGTSELPASVSPIDRLRTDFILEGGSIHVDGEGTVLTTEECLLNMNRNSTLTKQEIEKKVLELLGATKMIWLPRGLVADEDTNGHIDNICCFARPTVVLLAWTDDVNDEQYSISNQIYDILSNETDAKGRKITIIKLPVPKVPLTYTYDECQTLVRTSTSNDELLSGYEIRQPGQRMAASYVNFYIANNKNLHKQAVIVPNFDCEEDKQAMEILQTTFPNADIVPVSGREILLGGGNIHCITQQQPAIHHRR